MTKELCHSGFSWCTQVGKKDGVRKMTDLVLSPLSLTMRYSTRNVHLDVFLKKKRPTR